MNCGLPRRCPTVRRWPWTASTQRSERMFPYNYLLAAALLTQGPICRSPNWAGWFHRSATALAVAGRRLGNPRPTRSPLRPRSAGGLLLGPEPSAPPPSRPARRAAGVRLGSFPRADSSERVPGLQSCVSPAYRRRRPAESTRGWELRTALQETDHLYYIWDTVRDARCEYYYVTVRRQALKRLRDLLGEEAYYTTKLPPFVPLWRFQSIN